MKTPIDIVKGKIVDIDENGTVTIKAHYDDWYTLVKREYRECNIQMLDGRPLSGKQRKACYALLKEIAEFTGMGLDPTKEYMKIKFLTEDLQETADQMFSLSNAPMSLVCAFQRFLVRFILDWDIPCSFPLLDFVDDVSDYVYACLVSKKCCICGKPTDLHHVDHVGAGRDREEIVHEGMEVLPLCREHHTEVHTIGQDTFNEKHHITGGIILDKSLCRIYKLKRKEEEEKMLNEIILMGRLTRDPELRSTQSGTAVASFTIAVDRDFTPKGEEKQTDFIDIVAWRNTAEFVSKYFSKGRMAVVSGRLQIRPWEDKEGNKRRSAEVVAENVYFGDSKKSEDSGENRYAASSSGQFTEIDEDDGELPF